VTGGAGVSGENGVLDVAIAGGGAAGLYCAWRIAEADAAASVAVFEASERIGGRLYTVSPPGEEDPPAELGGIAVLSTHALVVGASDELGLERVPLRGGDPANLNYLRGSRFRADQWDDADLVPYRLAPAERGRSPAQILADAVGSLVPSPERETPRDWDELKKAVELDGEPLHELGLWNALRRLVSPDAFRLLADAGGFRPEFQNWNAAEAIADLSQGWPLEAHYECFRDGYESFPRALAERVRDRGGGIEVGQRLEAVELEADGDEPRLRLTLAVGEERRVVLARRLILALPAAAVAGLAPRTPLARVESFRRDAAASRAVPLVHLMLAYERPWWSELGIGIGRSTTDLPIQSFFYLGGTLAMIGYSSTEAVEYWDAYLPDLAGRDVPEPLGVPPAMLRELTRQVAELHGTDVPEPTWTALMDWRSGLYGSASHRWAIGARSWEVIPRMRRPAPQLAIHVCGEAWSDIQGWTEGALRSAERVLRDELGLERPAWMRQDAYLGP
jgi:monoamine oxidase